MNTHPKWLDEAAEKQVGNVWFVEKEPIDTSVWKTICIYAAIAVGVFCSLLIFSGALLWAWTTFFN